MFKKSILNFFKMNVIKIASLRLAGSALVVSLFFPLVVLGAMSSTDYYIYADSIDIGGGLSVGGNYSLQDTSGGLAVGSQTGGTYEILGGYQSMERGELSFSVSSSSLSMGILSTTTISVASTIVSVSADSNTGYTLSVGSISGTHLTNVADGSVTAGSEEYGVVTGGDQGLLATDTAITTSLILASSNAPIVNSQTTLTFKAAVSPSTVAGSYSQTVTLTASANF